jgi:hypothetical protein
LWEQVEHVPISSHLETARFWGKTRILLKLQRILAQKTPNEINIFFCLFDAEKSCLFKYVKISAIHQTKFCGKRRFLRKNLLQKNVKNDFLQLSQLRHKISGSNLCSLDSPSNFTSDRLILRAVSMKIKKKIKIESLWPFRGSWTIARLTPTLTGKLRVPLDRA